MTIISKLAGGLSLYSCLTDMHKTAVLTANNEYAKASADTFIETSIGSQKAEKVFGTAFHGMVFRWQAAHAGLSLTKISKGGEETQLCWEILAGYFRN